MDDALVVVDDRGIPMDDVVTLEMAQDVSSVKLSSQFVYSGSAALRG
ncbi:hypothetical protein [Pseudarthrobacter sp. H2]